MTTLEQAAQEMQSALHRILNLMDGDYYICTPSNWQELTAEEKDRHPYCTSYGQARTALRNYERAALNAQAAEQVHSADPFDKSFAREYETALHIGSRRFGSECQHENVMHGKCTNCLRTVI